MTNCGPAATESCCVSFEVLGGTFYRTYANTGSGPTAEANQATVSRFRLDKYEVTVGRFRQFWGAAFPANGSAPWLPSAGAGKHAHLNGGQGLANGANPGTYETGWLTSYAADLSQFGGSPSLATWMPSSPSSGTNANLPINEVDWDAAYAFCIWDGGFLPSWAEWEFAAAGGGEQREYPWGSTAPGNLSPYAIYGCFYPSTVSASCTGVANIAPVGRTIPGAGLWSQLDLAGNMNEWTLDGYADYVDPCTDCTYEARASEARVVGGGSYDEDLSSLHPQNRQRSAPTGSPVVGFRCARPP